MGKRALTLFTEDAGTKGPMPIVIGKIQDLLTEVSENKYTLWTADTAQAFYAALAKQLKALLELLGEYTSKPASVVKNGAETLYVFTINTLSTAFHTVDDDLLSPIIVKTQTGVYTLKNATSNTAVAVFTPIASAVNSYGISPAVKAGGSAKKCLVHTGAWLDSKTQLTDLAFTIASKGQTVDKTYLNGFLFGKGEILLATLCGFDTKFTGGFAQGVFSETVEEFKIAKKKVEFTSAGAPVY